MSYAIAGARPSSLLWGGGNWRFLLREKVQSLLILSFLGFTYLHSGILTPLPHSQTWQQYAECH